MRGAPPQQEVPAFLLAGDTLMWDATHTSSTFMRDYVQELSDPENKKRYEEEIKIMEQEKGNTIEFIHPEPFRALRTRVNGEQKCFINICANEKVGKPVCKWGVSDEGRGQCWSLPHNLHPERQERDPKGNKIVIYDVIFHPDTLHIASKNKTFMDMVESTAFQGIQNAFNVSLDKKNVREMMTKYKGTPQPCVIRKPIPGYKNKEPSEKPDPLAFPYPDEKRPTISSHIDPTESAVTKNSSDAEPQEPTEPNHTVKYRSFIDLQDFRCSRDSAQSPRPKEIVVTIDLPLLKVVRDASLEVKERRLLLESKKPAYRLELPLAYPVDEDKGEAKFNKQRGQLTVTLPVLPSNEAFDFAVGPAKTSTSGDERQEEKQEVEEEDTWKEKERGGLRSVEQRGDDEEEKVKGESDIEEEQTRVEKGKDEEESGQGKGKEQMSKGENCEEKEDIGLEAKWKQMEEEKVKEQKQEDEKEVGNLNIQKRQHCEDLGGSKHNELSEDGQNGAAEKKDSSVTSFLCDSVDQYIDAHAEENSCHEIIAERSRCSEEEGEVNLTSDVKEETEQTKEILENLKLGRDTAFLHDMSSKAVFYMPADTQSQNMKDCRVTKGTEESSKMPETDEAKQSSGGGSDDRAPLYSEVLAAGSVNQEEGENIDEDDLPTVQLFQNPEHTNKPPSVLREIDEHGNEKIISDHSTSAGFIFQNSLMYELD